MIARQSLVLFGELADSVRAPAAGGSSSSSATLGADPAAAEGAAARGAEPAAEQQAQQAGVGGGALDVTSVDRAFNRRMLQDL